MPSNGKRTKPAAGGDSIVFDPGTGQGTAAHPFQCSVSEGSTVYIEIDLPATTNNFTLNVRGKRNIPVAPPPPEPPGPKH